MVDLNDTGKDEYIGEPVVLNRYYSHLIGSYVIVSKTDKYMIDFNTKQYKLNDTKYELIEDRTQSN